MSLNGVYDDQNIFAKILRCEIPSVKILEDDHVIVIMDAFPQSEGHCLIIPRAPSRNLLEMEAKDIGRVFGTAQRVARAVKTALNPDGIVLTQFSGAPAGQTVFHTHIHIIPRFEGRASAPHASGKMADPDGLEQTAAKIRAAL